LLESVARLASAHAAPAFMDTELACAAEER
jgi:hypothetical protein